jgi:putative oxidoreductase
MTAIALLGRILFGLLFVGSAFGHMTQTDAMAGYAQSRGLPAARPAVLVSGLIILAGGVMVILGVWGDLGALLLVAFLLSTALLIHNFWRDTDPQTRQVEMVQFMKDLALAGAGLLVFVLFAYAGEELGATITGPLFRLGG